MSRCDLCYKKEDISRYISKTPYGTTGREPTYKKLFCRFRQHMIKIKFSLLGLFHPKTDLFPTRALIWVHFKTVHYFTQPIFSLFSYLKMHYTIQSLNCVMRRFFQNIAHLFIKSTHSFVAIKLLNFCKKEKTILMLNRPLTILAKQILFLMQKGVHQIVF